MAFSILIIAILSYVLCLPDICALVSIYGFQEDLRRFGASDYAHVRSRYGVIGLCYALLVDLIRALIAVLVGSVLLKNAGYPEIGKLLTLFFTLFFMLVGQAFPALVMPKPRRSMIYPAILLLFADWRVFLICAVLCGLFYLLTGLQGLVVLGAAILLPLSSLLFRSWSLFSFLRLLSGLSFAFAYLDVLASVRLLPRRITEIPGRLRSFGRKLGQRMADNARRIEEEEKDDSQR